MPIQIIKKEIIEIDSVGEEESKVETNSETVESSLDMKDLYTTYYDTDDIVITRDNTDSIVYSIIEKFKKRSDFGITKYGTNLDRKDLKPLDWIQHAQEEHMDAILYLEKLKTEIQLMENKLVKSEQNYFIELNILYYLFLIILLYNLFITQEYNNYL